MIGIYRLVSKATGRCYVGSSVNIENRFTSHMKMLRQKKHHSFKLQLHYNQFGASDLTLEILEKTKKKNLSEKERFYIDWYNSFCEGFNCTLSTKRTPNTNLEGKKFKDLFDRCRVLSNKKDGYGYQVVHTFLKESYSYADAVNRAIQILGPVEKGDFKRVIDNGKIVVQVANEGLLLESLLDQIEVDLAICKMCLPKKTDKERNNNATT